MKKNSITINGKEYVPVITKDAKTYLDDCVICDLKEICKNNSDIYCFLTVFKKVFKESKTPRHFELVKESEESK